MAIDISIVRAVVFDYGNTLVEFGQDKIRMYDGALAGVLERLFGPPDLEMLAAIRDRDRMAPYSGNPPEYRENRLPDITGELIRALYGRRAAPEQLDEVLRVRYEAFVELVEGADEARVLLDRLRGRYRLGLVSNYPDGAAIRASLDKVKLAEYFESVVVSGDIGYCKPHPLPFSRSAAELGVAPGEIVFVGDNWLADVQGAKRAGMQAVHLVQWPPHEVFDRAPDHFQPDAAASCLAELQTILLG
ncbi:MAG: HAD family hydrolase [Candidatus Hydrogenedentes bacterium]|nr:HAD family hydrolase [Candidatus Hydrogenedentota bacterium]